MTIWPPVMFWGLKNLLLAKRILWKKQSEAVFNTKICFYQSWKLIYSLKGLLYVFISSQPLNIDFNEIFERFIGLKKSQHKQNFNVLLCTVFSLYIRASIWPLSNFYLFFYLCKFVIGGFKKNFDSEHKKIKCSIAILNLF